MATDLCVERVQDLDPASPLLDILDPSLFSHIMSSPEIDTCGVSCHLSKLVASYCKKHELDEETFQTLTDRKLIPLIDKDAALSLLELELASHGEDPSVGGGELTSLRRCCITVLTQNWRSFAKKEENYATSFQNMSAQVLADIFQKTLLVANRNVTQAVERMDAVDEKFKAVESQLQNVMDSTCEILESNKREKEELRNEVECLWAELAQQQRELEVCKRELCRFRHVPNAHSFHKTKRCTFQRHFRASERVDNRGTSQYGRTPPTTMPKVGNAPEAGYLFLQKNGSQFDLWPVFYYKDV
jgi:hypothetical protein